MVDTSLVLSFATTVPANVVQMALPFSLTSPSEVLAFNLPLEIRIGSEIPIIDSVVLSSFFATGYGYFWELGPAEVLRFDETTGTVLIGAAAFFGSVPLPAGTNHLVTVFLSVTPSPAERDIGMTWGTIETIQPLPEAYPDDGLYPVVIFPGSAAAKTAGAPGFLPQYLPMLGSGACCVGERGNIDCSYDNVVDVGDVSSMIRSLFIDMAPYCCVAEADVDLSGIVDIGDLTNLIASLFISLDPLPQCP
jgi:hypothetical protein